MGLFSYADPEAPRVSFFFFLLLSVYVVCSPCVGARGEGCSRGPYVGAGPRTPPGAPADAGRAAARVWKRERGGRGLARSEPKVASRRRRESNVGSGARVSGRPESEDGS